MKIKVVIIDFEIPHRVKKWGLRVGIPLATVLGGGAIAWAAGLHTWTNGQPLDASDLNANFTYLQSEITALAQQGTGSGRVAGIWSNAPSAGCVQIATGTDWSDIDGTTVTFTLPQAATVWASYAINVSPDLSAGTTPGSEFVGFVLVVDGTMAEGSGNQLQPYATADANFTTAGNWVGSLAAGSHTIKLQWASATGTPSATFSNCYGDNGDNGAWTVGGASQQPSTGQRSVVVLASVP